MQRLPSEPKSPVRLLTDERGDTGMIEFLLAFPIFLTLLCLVGQLALLFVGQIVVEYAAFNAARSAIVWIPANTAQGAHNRLDVDTSKREHIERAAEISCVPISPGITLGLAQTRAGVSAGSLESGGLAADLWSRLLTDVALVDADGGELPRQHHFAEGEAVNVEVTHRFVLNVPIAATILGDGLPVNGLRTRTLTARATLLNQGRPHNGLE